MIVISGASGQTGHKIAEGLLAQGKQVRVISRKAEHVAKAAAQGAEVAVGDLSDVPFLTKALEGAEAAYVMIPPNYAATDWPAYQRELIGAWTSAIKGSGLKKVVMLSSMGSHIPEAGPVGVLGELERSLEAIPGLDVLILRPGYFMQNLYGQLGMVAGMGILGSSARGDVKVCMVHTDDIAAAALPYLANPTFTGVSRVFVPGPQDLTYEEVVKIIGPALGKPELPYVQFTMEDARGGMMGMGMPATIADGLNALNATINSGTYFDDFDRASGNWGGITLEQFASNELAAAAKAQEPAHA